MAETSIKILDNGPIVVTGSYEVQDASGASFQVEAGKSVALCRCGHSANKPFCDGGHRKAGFESQVKAE